MGIFGISVLLYLASNLTFFNFNFIYFSSIHFTSFSLLTFFSLLPSHNSPTSLSPLSDWGPIAYPSILALQVSGRLCASSPTKAKQGSPTRKKDNPWTGNSFVGRSRSSCLWPTWRSNSTSARYLWEGLGSARMFFGWWFRLQDPQGWKLVDFVCLLGECLYPLAHNPFPYKSMRVPKLQSLFGCGFLYLS